jgi:ESCRT-II complex subunit VPS36
MMTITEVYCRINRARGLELVSPEDVLNACKLLNGPMKLRQYPSGAMILQLENHNDDQVAEEIEKIVEEIGSMSIEECAREKHISVLLAHERFLIAERAGKVCRDESVEGLRFYPNLLLKQQ